MRPMRLLLRIQLTGIPDSRAAAHELLRRTLSQARPDVSANEWRYERDVRGKPHVAPGLPPLSFSLTHCHGLAACAVAPVGLDCGVDDGLDVGVDAEPLERFIEPLPIAHRLFTFEESAALAAVTDEDERRRAFLRLWTLKEATVKALGTGIAHSLQSFSFSLGDPPAVCWREPVGEDWRFQRWDVGGWSVALALRGGLAPSIDIDFQIAEPPP